MGGGQTGAVTRAIVWLGGRESRIAFCVCLRLVALRRQLLQLLQLRESWLLRLFALACALMQPVRPDCHAGCHSLAPGSR